MGFGLGEDDEEEEDEDKDKDKDRDRDRDRDRDKSIKGKKGGEVEEVEVELEGEWVYEPNDSGDPLPSGTHELRVTFYPTDRGRYNEARAIVYLTVHPNDEPVSIEWDPDETAYVGM